MIFAQTQFEGAWLISPSRHEDERGFFARTWCSKEFADHGLTSTIVQSSVSFNRQAGTLRGMHWQAAPYSETKIVRCTRGSIFDVIVDMRKNSATKGRWQGFSLTADNHESLYIPAGFAHGFQTLQNDTEVFYQMDQRYDAESARGFHHADSAVGIEWPHLINMISPKDESLPPLNGCLVNL